MSKFTEGEYEKIIIAYDRVRDLIEKVADEYIDVIGHTPRNYIVDWEDYGDHLAVEYDASAYGCPDTEYYKIKKKWLFMEKDERTADMKEFHRQNEEAKKKEKENRERNLAATKIQALQRQIEELQNKYGDACKA